MRELTTRLRQGITGLLLSVVPHRRAVQAEVDRRRDICRTCEHNSRRAASLALYRPAKREPSRQGGRCEACGCFIVPKTALQRESCPHGKW